MLSLLNPKSAELQEHNLFVWNELKSLCCPFYSHFTLWLISRVGRSGRD